MFTAERIQVGSEPEIVDVQELKDTENNFTAGPVSFFHQSGIGMILVGVKKESILMNKEAWSILAKRKALSPSGTDFLKALPMVIYQAVIEENTENESPIHRGVFQSGQRKYAVWSSPIFQFSENVKASSGYQKMVILERVSVKNPNLASLARKFRLTRREEEVVRLLVSGKSDRLIGNALGLSIETVRGHLKHVRSKMGVVSRLEVVTILTR